MRQMILTITAILLLAGPAAAQLTPGAQIIADCAASRRYQPVAPDQSAGITAACGSPSAVSATIAAGNSGMLSLKTLRKAARTAWKARIDAGTP